MPASLPMGRAPPTADEGHAVYLYELALELGVRSPDLVQRAAELGLGPVGPSSMLTKDQVDALSDGLGGPAVAGPPPTTTVEPATIAPVPASTLPPPVLAPPSYGASRVASAPPPPPSVAPSGTGAGGPAPAHPAPSWSAVPVAPTATPSAEAGRPGGDGDSRRSQLIAVGVLAPFLVALFAFMVVNSGPDRSRQDAIVAANTDTTVAPAEQPAIVGGLDADADRSDPDPSDAVTVPNADPCVTGGDGRQPVAGGATIVDCPETTASEPVGDDAELPTPDGGGAVPGIPPSQAVDQIRFCRAAMGVTAFELELAAALTRSDMIKTRQVILDGRDQWRADVGAMGLAGPADIAEDLDAYAASYGALVDPVDADTTGGEMLQLLAALDADASLRAGEAVNHAVVSECS